MVALGLADLSQKQEDLAVSKGLFVSVALFQNLAEWP